MIAVLQPFFVCLGLGLGQNLGLDLILVSFDSALQTNLSQHERGSGLYSQDLSL